MLRTKPQMAIVEYSPVYTPSAERQEKRMHQRRVSNQSRTGERSARERGRVHEQKELRWRSPLTWPMLICTLALSFAWMRRLVAELPRSRATGDGKASALECGPGRLVAAEAGAGSRKRGEWSQAASARPSWGAGPHVVEAAQHAPLARNVEIDVDALGVVHAGCCGRSHGAEKKRGSEVAYVPHETWP